MTDTMQALYRYTAEGRFSSYLTGPVLVLPHRGGLPGGLPGLRQAGADAPPAPARRRAGPPVPPGNCPPGAAGPGAGGHVPGCLDHRPGDPVTCAPAPVPGAQRSARARPSSPAHSEAPAPVLRPAAAAALPPAMPLRGEPDSRHLQETTAADRGLPVPRPPSQGKSRKGPQSLPGFRRQAAERTRILFPGGMYVGENSFHGAKCRRPIADRPPVPERSAIAIGQTPCGRSAGAFQISSQKGTAFLRAPDPAALGGGTSDRRHWWGGI